MIDLSKTSPHRSWLVGLFFGGILLLGLLIYPHYGISIDEKVSHANGMISLKYVAQLLAPEWVAADPQFAQYPTPLAEYYDRDYGVAFELPVTLLERLLQYNDVRDQFLLRHLCTFLVCFGGLIAMYQLAARRFQDWRLGLLGAAWLLLSPRLFADYFYNDKDAVFMALFAIAMNTGVRFLLRPTLGRLGWHALACAITIDVRIMGILLPLATGAMLGWRAVLKELSWRQVLTTGVVYAVLTAALVVAFWPFLWADPLYNFRLAFHNMKVFRWVGQVLYQGEMIASTELPWHYIPVWIGITTPLLYLGTGVLGIVLTLKGMAQQRWRLWATEQQLQDLLFLGLFASPLVAIVVLHSVVYDGWRQLYFVYPALLLLALRGWVALARWRPRWRAWPRALGVVTALSLLVTAAQMVRDHPLQNVYFNLLAGPRVEERFELDYWGLGYRQSLAYIAAHDPRPHITVFSPEPTPAAVTHQLLPDEQRARLTIVGNPDQADYFITNYRGHPYPFPYPHEVHQIWADGRKVHSVFRLRW